MEQDKKQKSHISDVLIFLCCFYKGKRKQQIIKVNGRTFLGSSIVKSKQKLWDLEESILQIYIYLMNSGSDLFVLQIMESDSLLTFWRTQN